MKDLVSLLDVNVLIALLEPNHIHHGIAHEWFANARSQGWATCPLTQNGFIRITSQRSYSYPTTPHVAIKSLRQLTTHSDHNFWPDSVSLLDSSVCDATRLLSSAQITDSYLLALAKQNRGKLVTFDMRLVANAVPDGEDHLHLIAQLPPPIIPR